MAAKTWNTRRTIGECMLSAFGALVVLAVIVAFDGRVREQVTMRFDTSQASSDVATMQAQAGTLGAIVADVVKDQAQNHAPMMIFVVAATALTVFMLRT